MSLEAASVKQLVACERCGLHVGDKYALKRHVSISVNMYSTALSIVADP